MENNITLTEDNSLPDEDNTEALSEERELRQKSGGFEDVAAMQALMCVLLGTALAAAGFMYPETGGELLAMLKRLISDQTELIKNPLIQLMEYLRG